MMLALVVAAMASLNKPETIARLGRVFGLQGGASGEASRVASPPPSASQPTSVDATPVVQLGPEWDQVQDNAPFLSAEDPAWYGLIEAVSQLSLDELQQRSLGEVTYAQLRAQPAAYRGRVVTVRGTVRQVIAKPLPENPLGLSQLFQLTVATAGGGEWPLIVYVRELPTGFPNAGNDLHEASTIDAAFFKNWSYSYGDGVGVAPVAVARTFAWKSAPVANPARPQREPVAVWTMILPAAVFAVALAAWVMRRTQADPRADLADALPGGDSIEAVDVRDQLARLASDAEESP